MSVHCFFIYYIQVQWKCTINSTCVMLSFIHVQLQAQLMELEEKAAVAGASQLTAEQELSKVRVPC